VSLNWKEINLVLSELNLPGMQIQKIWQSSFDVLIFQLFRRGALKGGAAGFPDGRDGGEKSFPLLISTSPLACRLHETFQSAPKSEKPLRFAEFLKSRMVNGYIEEALQLGDNRIVRLKVRRGENAYRIYIRLWSNAANVIATDEKGTILDCMKRLPKRGEISGGSYRPEEAGEGRGPRDYEIREFEGEGSFNKKVDRWYAEHGGRLSLDQLREEARRSLGKNRNRLETALERLREKEGDYAAAERFKEYGDMILSQSPPPGSAWLEGERFTGGHSIRIELDPQKGPAKNAEAYYERYRKAKSGLGELRKEIAAGEKELAELDRTEALLMEEDNPLRLEGLLKKLRRSSGTIRPAQPRGPKRPGLSFADGDWLILVGRDAGENDELLRRHVKGSDLWLHVRDWAGSYVFIKHRPGKTVPLEVLLDAGNLALFYSKGRNNGGGDLYYTQVKYLRRAKNGPRGLVIPTQEKNLRISSDQKRLKKLEGLLLEY
jgi:predicted ribosome quality control (RQC) complex YloA/Tae2 family protein